MEARTALLVALAIAVALPYVTVALLRGGRVGFFLFGTLFVAAFLLVVVSDLRSDGDAPANGD
jgi:hypothetical protein